MARSRFESDDAFSRRMRPHADAIYRKLWPGCTIHRKYTPPGHPVPTLDAQYGIDHDLKQPDGSTTTFQEKFRQSKYFDWPQVLRGVPDFTQEYRNAVGTEYERDGEWFRLSAEYYLFAWANRDETAFRGWLVLIIASYKEVVRQWKGLERIGKLEFNREHGRSSFFAIPCVRLQPAIWRASENIWALCREWTGRDGPQKTIETSQVASQRQLLLFPEESR